jgi:hypothetical protein
VDNVWDFSKLKHAEHGNPADLKFEVSKLINNVSSTDADLSFELKDAYTFAEVQQIILEATQNLKTELMKTLFIKKLSPFYKDFILSQEPDMLLIQSEQCGKKICWTLDAQYKKFDLEINNISIKRN